jgi:uncharacterized protein YfiM (DUF2279 family)
MKYVIKSSIITVGLFFVLNNSIAQDIYQSLDSVSKFRRNLVFGSHVLGGVGSLSVLSIAWYAEGEQSAFHWFNDNDQWLGMDKLGHLTTAYQITRIGALNYRWAGISEQKANRNAAITSVIFLTGIEVLDGFSVNWGASWGDMLANVAGVGLAFTNKSNHKLQFNLKFSYKPNDIANYRPELLGSNILEQSLKNYNGQTYWITLSNRDKINWLGISIGYGADGMTGGKRNVGLNASGETVPEFTRTAITRISLDLQLDKIKTKNSFLNTLLKGASFIKIPFPSIDYRWQEGRLGASWY